MDIVDKFVEISSDMENLSNQENDYRHSISKKSTVDRLETANRIAENHQAMPYINTDNNTDIKSKIDLYISYTFIYNDKTMDFMRVTEGRTYSESVVIETGRDKTGYDVGDFMFNSRKHNRMPYEKK